MCFYHRFLKEKRESDEHFRSNTLDSPVRKAWTGLTFEQVVKDHITEVKQKMGIVDVLIGVSAWYVKYDEKHDAAQINMIIDRHDRVINICEIKFSIKGYEIDKNYMEELRRKLELIRECTDTKKALYLTMITSYGIKENIYSSKVQSQVTMEGLFRKAE